VVGGRALGVGWLGCGGWVVWAVGLGGVVAWCGFLGRGDYDLCAESEFHGPMVEVGS